MVGSGKVESTLVVVPPSPAGKLSLFNAKGKTNFTIDVVGWFPDGSGIEPVAPTHIVDSTTGTRVPKAKLSKNATVSFPVVGVGGVPSTGVGSVVLRLTGIKPSSSTALTAFPAGTTRPPVPSLLAASAANVSNLVLVAPGAGGNVTLHNMAGKTNFSVDVLGWFPEASTTRFMPVSPTRILDTSTGKNTPKAKLGANAKLAVPVLGTGGVPGSGVAAVVVQITAVKPSSSTLVTVWPSGTGRPAVANFAAASGSARTRLVIVQPGTDGKIVLHNAKGKTNIALDVVGWFPDGHETAFAATLTDGTVVAGTGDLIAVNATSDEGGTVTTVPGFAAPQVGGHIVVMPQALAPEGVVGAVTNSGSNPDGSTVLTLAPTSLDAAFSDLDASFKGGLPATPQAATSSTVMAEELARPAGLECKSGGSVSVTYSLDVDFTDGVFQLDWTTFSGAHLLVRLNGSLSFDASVSVSAGFSCSVALGTYTILLPFATLDVEPTISISVSAELSASR